MCRCTESSVYALGIISGMAILTHSGNLIYDQCIDSISSNATTRNEYHCWVIASMYLLVGFSMIITDVAVCKSIAQKLAFYQSFRGRSFIYLFVSLPLLSTYDGDFDKTISDPLESIKDIPLMVGLILLINSVIFLLFSLCGNGSFPKRGVIAALRGDRDSDFPLGFEEEKATAFDDAVEMAMRHLEQEIGTTRSQFKS